MKHRKILLLDPDPALPHLLASSFECTVNACRLPEELPGKLLDAPDLVIGETEFLEAGDTLASLSEIRKQGIPAFIWTSHEVDPYLTECRAGNLSMLLTKTSPLLLDEIGLAIQLRLRGYVPGISKYLGGGSTCLGHEELTALNQVGKLCRHVQSGLEGPLATSRRLRLVLDELISNALHHSSRSVARLEWGMDHQKHIFVVKDESGSLDALEAMRLLDRHLRGEGLMDPRGRGLHLSRIHADRLYATVVPGKVSEIVAVFWNTPGAFQGAKPVWFLETGMGQESNLAREI
ncbi:MAG: hypothetical protein IPK50_17505 [Fibrobacterota bacterium]|nr:hypothetical protein [Fibrobacterota bacterium]QQS04072.1 MAG: hypothetical protein IPK50_17505 [Fibrobacterota bacterium]